VSYTEFEEEEFTTQFNGRILLRILSHAGAHWKWLVALIIGVTLVSSVDGYYTYLSKRVIDEAIVPGNRSMLWILGAQYIGITLGQGVFVYGMIWLAGNLGQIIQYDLRRKMFDHLQALSFSYFDRTPVGWIMSRVTSDSERIAELMSWGILDTTWSVVSIITSLYFMLIINWRLGLIIFAIVPILSVVAIYFKRKIIVQYRLVRKINSKITGAFNENISGVRVIKALGREKQNLSEFSEVTGDMYRASYRAAWLSALFLPTVQLVSAAALGAVIWFSGVQFRLGGMTIGGVQAFISYVTFMLMPIQDLAGVFANMQLSIASAERVFSLIDAVPDIVDREKAVDPGTLRGDIVFDHVSFSYEEGKAVLDDFNLTVRRGETIALVGPTGGGKSTIVNLLCRFYEPTGGRIVIGGRDYKDLTLQAIQSRLGVVLQTPHLFSGTIRENIRYGRLQATDEEVEEAARLAGAHDFITAFAKGYEDEVGEGGELLSVGQKQLISLARAILAKPEIFVMDEATSSVDTLTESLIQQAMDVLLRDSTSFVIAHRLSTIRRADRILVIENGRIVEMGSHEELIQQRGHYYGLYTKQFARQSVREVDKTYSGAPASSAQ